MKMKIVALFLCLSQLVASEDVAATKDLNTRHEVTSKSIFSKIFFNLGILIRFLTVSLVCPFFKGAFGESSKIFPKMHFFLHQ